VFSCFCGKKDLSERTQILNSKRGAVRGVSLGLEAWGLRFGVWFLFQDVVAGCFGVNICHGAKLGRKKVPSSKFQIQRGAVELGVPLGLGA